MVFTCHYCLISLKLSFWVKFHFDDYVNVHTQVAPSGYSDKKNIHQNGLRGRLVPYWDYQKNMVTNSRPEGIAQKSGRQVPVEQLSLGSPGSHFQANFFKTGSP